MRFRLGPTALTVALLVVLGSGVAGKGAQAFRGEQVYVAARACVGHATRPARIVLACGTGQFYADRLRFRSWASKAASATGSLHLDDCEPNCAQGHFRDYAGSVVLKGVVRCSDGRLYYSKARYRFTGAYPGGARSGDAPISPVTAHCGRVLG